MKERRKNSTVGRILAWVIAAAVAVSILTIPQTESYAAGGKVTKVAVSNLPAKQLTLKKGKTFTLKPKVTVTGKISKKVTYKTSNKKVVAVNAKGKITAKKKRRGKIQHPGHPIRHPRKRSTEYPGKSRRRHPFPVGNRLCKFIKPTIMTQKICDEITAAYASQKYIGASVFTVHGNYPGDNIQHSQEKNQTAH